MADAQDKGAGEPMQRFLAWASREMTITLDYETRLGQLARLAVPALGDCCVVDILEDGERRRLPVAYADPAQRGLAQRLQDRSLPGDDAVLGITRVLEDGRPCRHVFAACNAAADGIRSTIAAPLACEGRMLGAIAVVCVDERRRHRQADVAIVEDFALRAASAIDNARVHRDAREAVHTRDRVLSIVSHDLRNELAIMVSSCRFLEYTAALRDLPDESHALRRISLACANMQHLVGDLLDMAAIRAGRLALHREAAALDSVIAGVADAYEPVALEAQVRLHASIERGINACCDVRRTRQAVGNIVANAIKHSTPGATVRIALARQDGCALVSVCDDGPGIPPDQAARLFDEFASFDRGGKAGTGLGLFIARVIVERHGGHIRLESAVGQGSTFTVSLPLS